MGDESGGQQVEIVGLNEAERSRRAIGELLAAIIRPCRRRGPPLGYQDKATVPVSTLARP